MSHPLTRRRFLQTAGTGPLGAVVSVGRATVEEVEPIRFGPDLEPVVKLIEETPREKCVAVLAEQLRAGLPYRRFLAAVFLATLRKQNSHHSLYLVHSAHQVSLNLPARERLLPLFWAVDHFKWHQQKFPTPALNRLAGQLPDPQKAAAEFHEAMQRSDVENAERAAVALARSAGARQAFDVFWQYGCRDVSLIGHRAIAVTNCWRVLETIGWEHGEPVLRFVVQNLLTTNGRPDRYYRPNLTRVEKSLEKLPAGWPVGRPDRGATMEMFTLLRRGQSESACELAVGQLVAGTGAQPLWDALHIAAAELLILHDSETGIAARPLHANTTVNALHFAYNAIMSPRVRLLILLQATAWVGDFIRSHLGEQRLDETRPVDLGGASPPAPAANGMNEIFESLPPRAYDLTSKTPGGYSLARRKDRSGIGRKVFALIEQAPDSASTYLQHAHRWLCEKAAVEAHEFKLPAALFEDYKWVSREWRPRLLAASAHWLHGKQSPDSRFLQEARNAIKNL